MVLWLWISTESPICEKYLSVICTMMCYNLWCVSKLTQSRVPVGCAMHNIACDISSTNVVAFKMNGQFNFKMFCFITKLDLFILSTNLLQIKCWENMNLNSPMSFFVAITWQPEHQSKVCINERAEKSRGKQSVGMCRLECCGEVVYYVLYIKLPNN